MIESEKKLEAQLRDGVMRAGGWSLKMLTAYVKGLPDRLCLLPQGRIFFAEIKTTKKKPTPIQLLVQSRIRKLGFRVEVLDSSQQIKDLLKEYE